MKFLSFGRLFGDRWAMSNRPHGRRSRSRKSPDRTKRTRLALETLEDRTVLSIIPTPVVGNYADISTTTASFGGASNPTNHTEPAIAVDPIDPTKAITVYTVNTDADMLSPFKVEAQYTRDGGKTWLPLFQSFMEPDPATNNPIKPFQQATDASVAFDANNQAYVLYYEHGPGAPTSTSSGNLILRRFDFTTSVPQPVALVPSNPVGAQTDNIIYQFTQDSAVSPTLAVDANPSATDPYSGTVYVAYATVNVAPPTTRVPAINFNPNVIRIMASADGGLTFGASELVNRSNETGSKEKFAAPRLAISDGTPDGRVAPGQVNVVWDNFGTGATITPVPLDFIGSDRMPAGFSGGSISNNSAMDIANGGVTTDTVTVDVSQAQFANFSSLSDIQVTVNILWPNLSELQIQLMSPGGQMVTLLNNRINAAGGTISNFIGTAGANLGVLNNGIEVGTTFDDKAVRSIVNSLDGASAPFAGHFIPENPLGGTTSPFFGLSKSAINGTWSLIITDPRADTSTMPKQILNWSLQLNSGLAPAHDVSVPFSTNILGAITSPYPLKTPAMPNRGVGPGIVITADDTQGTISAHRGRLYLAYVDRPQIPTIATDSTNVELAVSDDGGKTWSFLGEVNDDQGVVDGFSGGNSNPLAGPIVNRPHFQPALAVDQSTGTLVVSFYDARNDPARTRVAQYFAVSIDGGNNFSPETFFNQPATAFNEITQQNVVLGPTPDNNAGTNPNANNVFGFGDRQGLAIADGKIYAAWTGNFNGGVDGKHLLDILGSTATYAAGPRIIRSTMGPVTPGLGEIDPDDGTLVPDAIQVTFDRPIDQTTFTIDQVVVRFTSPTGVVVQLPISGVTRNGSSDFTINFDPSPLFRSNGGPGVVGTYSYTIGPDITDGIPSAITEIVPSQTVMQSSGTINLPVPAFGTGGTGNPALDDQSSTLNFSGVSGVVSHISVTVNINHTDDSDLRIHLISPSGTDVLLANRNGVHGQNFQGTVFDDNATQSINTGFAPFSGSFRPVQLLGTFGGETPTGTDGTGNWTLLIEDVASFDSGTLVSWSMTMNTGTVTTVSRTGNPMDQNANGVVDPLVNGNPNDSADAYSAPLALGSGSRFSAPFDQNTLPIIVPGPQVVGASVVNGTGPDNTVLNTTVSGITVTFDRNMNPFNASQVLRVIGPTGVIGPGGTIPAKFQVTPQAVGRSFLISFQNPDGTPLKLSLSGTYTVTLGSGITSTAGDALDTNADAGVDVLRQTATGTSVPVVFNSTGTAAIGDPNSSKGATKVDSSITVPSLTINQARAIGQTQGSILVQLNIAYPHDPDLSATLTFTPAGGGQPITVNLFSNVGISGSQANFTTTVFDDFASTPITAGGPPFTGHFNPQIPLSDFFGGQQQLNVAGTWTLEIQDSTSGPNATGTLTSWSLTFAKPQPITGLGESVADQATTSFRIFTMGPSAPQAHETWTPVGPASISGNTESGAVGGLAVDPSDPSGNTVYVGGANGGVWKTTNFLTTSPSGPTYTPLTDFGPNFGINIGSISVFGRNNDPRQSIVIAATGNGDQATQGGGDTNPSANNSAGVGFLRSMDGGATWTLLDSTVNVDSNGNTLPITSTSRDHKFVGTWAFKVLVDPRPTPTGQVIIYGALGGPNGGLWRSTDTGDHWQLMKAGQATDIVFDPNSGTPDIISNPTGNLKILYAAFAGDGVYVSPNQGQVLNKMLGTTGDPLILNGDFSPLLPVPVTAGPSPNGAKGRIVLAKPALTGNPIQDLLYESWLYALVIVPGGNSNSVVDGLYLTKDLGQNWTKVDLRTVKNPGGGLGDAIPTNDITQDPYSVTSHLGFADGNFAVSIGLDPNNPNIVYLGGTQNGQASGFLRVDVTGLSDPHSFFVGQNKNDGKLLVGSADPVTLELPPTVGFSPFSRNPITDPISNLVRNPNDPFNGNSTVVVFNTKQFNNNGTGATWIPFDIPINSDGSSPNNSDQHRMIVIDDPLTGHARLIIGDDTGVYTAVDNNGVFDFGIGSAKAPIGTRNGNLQITQFYSGTGQPSNLAAQIAGALFYGMSFANGFPQSDPNILNTGNLAWNNPPPFGNGAGTDVAVDQTGVGTLYQSKWPNSDGGLTDTDFFQVTPTGGIAGSRTFGLIQQSNQTVPPDPQWPLAPSFNFAVNPIEGNQIVISSLVGRIFGSIDQARTWLVIGEPSLAGFDGTNDPALAFGAPQSNDPTGALNDFVYAGSLGGHIYVTFTGGGAQGNQWSNISSGLDGAPVHQIIPDPTRNTKDAYAVTSTGVFYTTDSDPRDGTVHWTNITGNLHSIQHTIFPTNSSSSTSLVENHVGGELSSATLQTIAADWRYAIPGPAGTTTTFPVLYVGGASGVYRSLDNGVTWTVFPDMVDDGAPIDGGYLPNADVTRLQLVLGNVDPTTGHPVLNTVILHTGFSQGAGVASITLDAGASAVNNFYSGEKILINSGAGKGQLRTILTYDGTTKVATVDTPWTVQPGTGTGFQVSSQEGPDILMATTGGRGAFAIRLAPVVIPSTVGLDPTLPGPGGSDNGVSKVDKVTSILNPVIDGLSEAGAFANALKVQLFDLTSGTPVEVGGPVGSNIVAAVQTDGTGAFKIQVVPGHFKPDGSSDGTITLGVVLTDSVTGVVSNQFQFTYQLDTTPVIQSAMLDSASDSSKGQGITNVTRPFFDGTVAQAAPLPIQFFDVTGGQRISLGTGTTAADGSFHIQVTQALSGDGLHTIEVDTVRPSGKNSAPLTFSFTLLTALPAKPGVPELDPLDLGGSATPNQTDVTTPDFLGNVQITPIEQPVTVNLFVDGQSQPAGSNTVSAQGNYQVEVNNPLSNGPHVFTVQIVDVAGNVSPFSDPLTVTINTTGPGLPTIGLDSNYATGNPNFSAVQPQLYDGTADVGTTVVILDNGLRIDTFAQTGPTNAFSRFENLGDGTHTLVVTATDQFGHSKSSNPVTITINLESLDPDRKFIRQLYSDDLGRPGSLTEWNLWIGALSQPNGRNNIANAIVRSPESRDFVVKGWYQTYLGRQALNGEEAPWVNALLAGATEEQVLSGILSSGEYLGRTPGIIGTTGSGTNTTFVKALYSQLLGRTPATIEVNFWLGQLNTLNRQQVALLFLGSEEYRGDVIRGYYANILRRPTVPSQAEVNSWVFSGQDFATIRVGFEGSQEYFFRITGFIP
jgi:subtilisin-like proprotein convertase family protein